MNEINAFNTCIVKISADSKGGKPAPFCSKVTHCTLKSIENKLWIWVTFLKCSFVQIMKQLKVIIEFFICIFIYYFYIYKTLNSPWLTSAFLFKSFEVTVVHDISC